MNDNTASEITPATSQELARFVAENANGKQRSIAVAGGRTALQFGLSRPPHTTLLSTTELNDVIDYPVHDMTITLQAGMRVDRLHTLLTQENQQLPVDIPQANRATIGGAVATNTSGPRRFGYGTLRDYLIGITAVDASGQTFSAGGRVVKNVAGYDLCKLLTGSLGTLAIITQLTLKLKPQPACQAALWINIGDLHSIEKALSNLLHSDARPVVIEYLNHLAVGPIAAEARLSVPIDQPALVISVEGTAAEVNWQTERLQQEFASWGLVDCSILDGVETQQLILAITEFSIYADAPLTFTASIPASRTVQFLNMCAASEVAAIAHAGNGIVLGILPDSIIHFQQAGSLLRPLRTFAQELQGSLTVLECDSSWKQHLSVFDNLQCLPLMRVLKQNFDPDNLLNPGLLFS